MAHATWRNSAHSFIEQPIPCQDNLSFPDRCAASLKSDRLSKRHYSYLLWMQWYGIVLWLLTYGYDHQIMCMLDGCYWCNQICLFDFQILNGHVKTKNPSIILEMAFHVNIKAYLPGILDHVIVAGFYSTKVAWATWNAMFWPVPSKRHLALPTDQQPTYAWHA